MMTKDNNQLSNSKYIFVLGGVMSGVGKGITTASIGTLLQAKGYTVSLIKADPYLNVDAGTMNPTEHGEVFVLENGLETDQDMGNYERFLGKSLPGVNYMTNGMIFKYVIDKERALGYKGKCVEPTYHISEEILRRIEESVKTNNPDVTIFEIGGTIGEYQNAIFIEAARLLKLKYPKDVSFVMVSYLPVPSTLGEMKTKPTQNAVRQMNSYGVSPDFIIARSNTELDEKRKEKIANMCGVYVDNVISAPDVSSIYEVPVNFEKDKLGARILEQLGLPAKEDHFDDWRAFAEKIKASNDEVNIAVVGKYFDTGDFVLSDAYISVIESLKIAGYHLQSKVNLHWLDSKDFESEDADMSQLDSYDGVLVPGGFGETGIEGKIKVINYVRENKIPYFGLCYGMQLATVEYARNVLGLKNAHTVEINPDTDTPIIDVMPDQKEKIANEDYGGTMRLGLYPAKLKEGSIAHEAYGQDEVQERHRHRYEVNPDYIEQLEQGGLVFSAKSPDGQLMEIAELPRDKHPFFLGTQFHPEFTTWALKPQPLFTEFIKASIEKSKNK